MKATDACLEEAHASARARPPGENPNPMLVSAHRKGFPEGYAPILKDGEGPFAMGIDFGIHKQAEGGAIDERTHQETVWVLMGGKAVVEFPGKKETVERHSLFDEEPTALHLAANAPLRITALTDVEWAVARVENTAAFEARLFRPEEVEPEYRGKGLAQDTCLRNVRLIFDRGVRPQANLVIGEVVNYPGRWSSYPPHHHDQPEMYHYRFTLPQGYGHGESGDSVFKIRQYDTLMIPGGGRPFPGLRAGLRDVLPLDRPAPARQPVHRLHLHQGPRMDPGSEPAGVEAEAMKRKRLTMAGAVVEFLKQQYVHRDAEEHRLIHGVFGIFGHGNVAGLGLALEEYGGVELPYYQPKNEQAMVHTAAAFAKARNRLGTFACTTSVGPGATNMVTGAAAATVNRLPVLLLPGDTFANRLPNPVLQQLEFPHSMDTSVNDCFRPVSKYWDRIQRPEQLLRALPEAMRVLADPAETGAVTLCLPQDVQTEAYDFPANFFERRIYAVPRQRAAAEQIREAAAKIARAKRPMLIAGGGVHYSEAERALEAFVKAAGIPVGVTQAGVGSLPDEHPCCLGAVGTTGNLAANRIAERADLVMIVGTRLSDFTTASKTQFKHPRLRFLSINVNAYDAHKHGAYPLIGDARVILEDLTEALEGHCAPKQYQREVAAAKTAWVKAYETITRSAEGRGRRLTQAQVIRILNEQVGKNATVVHAAGGIPGDIHKLWRSRDPRDYHSEYGYSCMGYEIAGALGVKYAAPEREVYAFLGDGSYLMLNHEIVTSIQEGRKITIVLNDNHGYQCIHNLQRSCGSRGFGNEFRSRNGNGQLEGKRLAVDYRKNAESLGASTFYAGSETGLREALSEARREERTCLIYVPVEPYRFLPGYSWWDVPVPAESDLKTVKVARKKYEGKLVKQRLYY